MNQKEVGRYLRELRGERTLDKVSDDTGIGRSALNMYELGLRVPRDEAKVKLSQYYKVPIDIFFRGNFTNREE